MYSSNETANVSFPSLNAVSGTYGANRSNGAEPGRDSAVSFSNILNNSLKEQAMQSVMTKMHGSSGQTAGIGGFGGTNAMLSLTGGLNGINGISGFMPSSTAGIENTLISAAGSGEMSGSQLVLYMLIMMMQSGNSSSDMAPLMQMMAGMLSKSTEDTGAVRQNNTAVLGGMQGDTTIGVKRMVDIAMSQVGYRERNSDGSHGNGNFSKFGEWYGMNGQPWCAMFVSWAAEQAGIAGSVVPKHAYTPTGVEAYKARGLYASSDSGYIPREGDAIYFYSERKGRIGHVGIVVAYDPETQKVYTVEGNTSNAVRIRHYDINNPRIDGYGRNGGTGFGTIPGDSSSGAGASTLWD